MSSRVRAAWSARTAGIPSWVLMIQLFIGLGWLRAATEKIISVSWWQGEELSAFLIEHAPAAVGWYRPFIDYVVAPYPVLIGAIVVVAQVMAAVSLLTGRRVALGLSIGVFLNVNFLAAGAVDPSAFYLVLQGAVALWLAEQTRTVRTQLRLWVAAVAAGALGLLSLPSIRTVLPAEVIRDPAIMFVTAGLLTAIACDLAHRRITDGAGLLAPARSLANSRTG